MSLIKAFKMSFDSTLANKMTEREFVDLHIKSDIIATDVKKREKALKEVYKLAKDIEDKASGNITKEKDKAK